MREQLEESYPQVGKFQKQALFLFQCEKTHVISKTNPVK